MKSPERAQYRKSVVREVNGHIENNHQKLLP